jgi:hypothetical protein
METADHLGAVEHTQPGLQHREALGVVPGRRPGRAEIVERPRVQGGIAAREIGRERIGIEVRLARQDLPGGPVVHEREPAVHRGQPVARRLRVGEPHPGVGLGGPDVGQARVDGDGGIGQGHPVPGRSCRLARAIPGPRRAQEAVGIGVQLGEEVQGFAPPPGGVAPEIAGVKIAPGPLDRAVRRREQLQHARERAAGARRPVQPGVDAVEPRAGARRRRLGGGR